MPEGAAKGGYMKRWQIEQILYLNDIGKEKLTLSPQHQIVADSLLRQEKKENYLLDSIRKGINFLLRIL